MLRRNIITLLIAAAILYLSLAPSQDFDGFHIGIPHFDKLVHAGMYFILMITITYQNRPILVSWINIVFAASVSFLYGVLMEILQLLTLNRSASVYDALADLAGIVLAVISFRIIASKSKPSSDNYKF